VSGGTRSPSGADILSIALRASRRTIDELGREGLAELAEHLWAGDCQTCGRPLGDQRAALLVDDLMASASASLHHPHCQRPEWNDSGGIKMSSAEQLTHFTCSLMIPFPATRSDGHPVEQRPMLLVNPGLELVMLRRGPDDRWRVATVDLYAYHGLHLPSADLRNLAPEQPVPGVQGRLTAAGLVIEFPHTSWTASVEPTFDARVRELGGVVLAVTTMVHPGRLTTLQPLAAAVKAGQVAMGWVAVNTGDGPSGEQFEQRVHALPPAAAGTRCRGTRGPT
jgi:hypothetical protein